MARTTPLKLKCVICGFTFHSTEPRKTCGKMCLKQLTIQINGHPSRKKQKRCGWCGEFHKNRGKHCSPECSKAAQKRKKEGGGLCKVCGRATKNKHNITCSGAECLRKWRSETASRRAAEEGNVCKYTPPSIEDKEGMIAILKRKGFSEGHHKENYQWSEDKEGNLLWRDLPPSHTSIDGQAAASEELQKHWDGVEQETEEEGANLPSLKELRKSFKVWLASA